jgi:hypothetical protein
LGTKLQFTPTFQPNQNGHAERRNQSILKVIRAIIFDDAKRPWHHPVSLAFIAYALNNRYSQTLQCTPTFALFALHPRTSADLALPPALSVSASEPAGPRELAEQMTAIASTTREHIAQQQDRSAARRRISDKAPLVLSPGQLVYVETAAFRQLAKDPELSSKVLPKYIGLFKVIARNSDVMYQLELPESFKGHFKHDHFHISKLRPYVTDPLNPSPPPKPPVYSDLLGDFYEIERILQCKGPPGPNQQCIVHWKGYPHSLASWHRFGDLKAHAAYVASKTAMPPPTTSSTSSPSIYFFFSFSTSFSIFVTTTYLTFLLFFYFCRLFTQRHEHCHIHTGCPDICSFIRRTSQTCWPP